MRFWQSKTGMLKAALDVLLVAVPLLAFYFLAPQAVIKIRFTYRLFYTTTHNCFPNLTAVAFLALFVIPQLFTCSLLFLAFTRLTTLMGGHRLAAWLVQKGQHSRAGKFNATMAGLSAQVRSAAKYILPALFIVYLLVRFTWVDGGNMTHLVQLVISRLFVVLLLLALLMPVLFNSEKKKMY